MCATVVCNELYFLHMLWLYMLWPCTKLSVLLIWWLTNIHSTGLVGIGKLL